MRKLAYVLTVVTVACSLIGCGTISPLNPSAGAAGQPPPSATAAAAAQEGLATFQRVINANNYAALGFGSPDEVRRATLGEPLPIFRVGLDALRASTEQTNPSTLLIDARRSLYPVEVDRRVATSIFVTQASDGWRATDLGTAAVARAVTRYRSRPTDFIVHVPALKVYFVGRRVEGTLVLTPVKDDPRTGFKAGDSLPAGRAFMALQRAAQGYNGLPQ
jgi:hypothetical protein